jgi:hypothetical protein
MGELLQGPAVIDARALSRGIMNALLADELRVFAQERAIGRAAIDVCVSCGGSDRCENTRFFRQETGALLITEEVPPVEK